MIQLESIHVEKFRGIRNLQLELNRKSYGIFGPNGSGKSGVVDSIEFALTGKVSRLSGKGSKDVSVKKHGPHVDSSEDPGSSFVRLNVFVPSLNKSATISRNVKQPHKMKIEPNEPDILDAIKKASEHPEIALSRREISNLIVIESASRSKEIQVLLRLDSIEKTRAVLKAAEKKTAVELKSLNSRAEDAKNSLLGHLGLKALVPNLVLRSLNARRTELNLEKLTDLNDSKSFKEGLVELPGAQPPVSKSTANADFQELQKVLQAKDRDSDLEVITAQLAKLDDPEFHVALRHRKLIEAGIPFVNKDECPLCDSPMPKSELLNHLQEKLDLTQAAEEAEKQILNAGNSLKRWITSARSAIAPLLKLGMIVKLPADAAMLRQWSDDLARLAPSFDSIDGVIAIASQLQKNPLSVPEAVVVEIQQIQDAINSLPSKNKTE